jgi:hypothetical protein
MFDSDILEILDVALRLARLIRPAVPWLWHHSQRVYHRLLARKKRRRNLQKALLRNHPETLP